MTRMEQLEQLYKEREKLFEEQMQLLEDKKAEIASREREMAEQQISQAIPEYEERIATYEERISDYDTQITAYEEKIRQQENKISSLEGENELLQDKNEEYLLALETLRNESLKSRLAGEQEALPTKVNTLRGELEEKDREIQRLQQTKNELEEENSSLRRQLLETQKDNGMKSYYTSSNASSSAQLLYDYLNSQKLGASLSHNREGEIVHFKRGNETIYVCFEKSKTYLEIFKACADGQEIRDYIAECNKSQNKIRFEYDSGRLGIFAHAKIEGNTNVENLTRDILAVWEMYFGQDKES